MTYYLKEAYFLSFSIYEGNNSNKNEFRCWLIHETWFYLQRVFSCWKQQLTLHFLRHFFKITLGNHTFFSTRIIIIYKLIQFYEFYTSFIWLWQVSDYIFNQMLKTNLAWLCLRFLILKQKQQHNSRRSSEKIN